MLVTLALVALAQDGAAARPAAVAAASPDTIEYVVLNHGREAGAMRVAADGDSVLVRYHHVDRNRGPRSETVYRLGADGALLGMATRGMNPTSASQPQAVRERFEVAGGRARWHTPQDSGETRAAAGATYWPRSGTPFDDARLARWLLARPRRTGALLPAGEARAEVALDTVLTGERGERERVRLVLMEGVGLSPLATWLDARGAPFASDASWFITVRRGWEHALPALRAAELRVRARRSAALARRLAPPPASVLVVRNGDVFDSERGVVRPRTTVVVEGDRIVAVGPAESVRVPAGARVVDATGRTVIPGLWDMHGHVFQTQEEDAALHLAAGVTTVRDMAADVDAATSFRARSDSGVLVGPRYVLAGFLEGPGAWAGPSEALVRTEAEARAWVARYDSLGYRQVKLYNVVHPDLVPTIVEEAHRRGMRVSGHVPRGLSVPAAVQLGFDEIQHGAFLLATFYQDSLYVPRMRAYSAVAYAVAPRFDVGGAPMTALIGLLKQRGTVVDGTFNLYQARGRTLPDGSDQVLGPAVGWMPAPMRRVFTYPRPTGPDAFAVDDSIAGTYGRLLKRLFDAGVTLVPGTDNVAGFALHGELETYERAGIPAAEVLRIATIVPARVMGDTARYGSIAPGKVADLAIVDGRPAERIGDLRRVEQVVRAGRLYESRALLEAIGMTPGGEHRARLSTLGARRGR